MTKYLIRLVVLCLVPSLGMDPVLASCSTLPRAWIETSNPSGLFQQQALAAAATQFGYSLRIRIRSRVMRWTGGAFPAQKTRRQDWMDVQILRGGQIREGLSLDEPIALADPKTRRPLLESASRREIHTKGKKARWHQVVHVYYFVESTGDFVLQRRSMNLAVSPGKIQISASGHVDAKDIVDNPPGKDSSPNFKWIEAVANRESEEEMGILLDTSKLTLISFPNQIQRDDPDNKEFATVLLYSLSDEELKQVHARYNLSEVSELVVIPARKFKQLLEKYPNDFSGSLQHMLLNHPQMLDDMIATALNSPRPTASNAPGDPESSAGAGARVIRSGYSNQRLRTTGFPIWGRDGDIADGEDGSGALDPLPNYVRPFKRFGFSHIRSRRKPGIGIASAA